MSENEERLLQAIHSELRETNNVLSGISGFIWNFVFWSFFAGLFFVLGSFFEPAFFFPLAGLLGLIGLVLSLSALKFRWSLKSLWDSEPKPHPEREAPPQEKPRRKLSGGESGLIVAFLLAVAIGGLGLFIFL
jgi:hypothetical protein